MLSPWLVGMCGDLRSGWLVVILVCSFVDPLDTASAEAHAHRPPPPPPPPPHPPRQPERDLGGGWDLPMEKEARDRPRGAVALGDFRSGAEKGHLNVPAGGVVQNPLDHASEERWTIRDLRVTTLYARGADRELDPCSKCTRDDDIQLALLRRPCK